MQALIFSFMLLVYSNKYYVLGTNHLFLQFSKYNIHTLGIIFSICVAHSIPTFVFLANDKSHI